MRSMPKIEMETGRIAILGTGREGRAAWRYLRDVYPGIELTLIDEKSPDQAIAGALTERDRIVTGPLSQAGLEGFDVLVRSPGISVYRASLRRAAEAGVTITTPSNLWFAAHRDQRTVCITGTKGKSTTSALLAHLLATCGYAVRLAGNIGKPLLECDDQCVDWWVIELSSYQLTDLEAEPTLAVILNLSPEHLDWHGSAAIYYRDKLRLAELAGSNPVFSNAADPALRAALADRDNARWFNREDGIRAVGKRLFEGERELAVRLPVGLPGAHNLSNVAAALAVACEIGIVLEEAVEAVSTFRPLPHRLQLLGEREGLRFVNDSISSTPVATVAALESFAGEIVTLIVGGLDRGLDWVPYMEAFGAMTPQAIVGVPDNGARIVATLRDAGIHPQHGLHEASDLAAAVRLARRITPRGAIVLLSPGAPSFPQFRDYRERGRRFAESCGFAWVDADPF
jgi:UDP-N-acetylmuramoylalanine--D-glutamate ligase